MSADKPYRPLTKKTVDKWEQRWKVATELQLDLRIEQHELGEFWSLVEHARLAMPPVPEVAGAHPLVLYFATPEDREEMIDAVHSAKPNMRSVKL